MKITHLAPAPRNIPWPLKISLVLGRFTSLIGGLLLFTGSLTSWLFVGESELVGVSTGGPKASTQAVVASVKQTSAKVNSHRVFEIRYHFFAEGDDHQGRAYVDGRPPQEGTKIPVEYQVSHPENNRAPGFRSALFPGFVAFVLIFPAVGLVFFLIGVPRGLAAIQILSKAETAWGTLLRTEPTNMRINNRPVIRYIFQFEALGQTWEAKGETSGPALSDEPRELIFYDPANPRRALVADALPGKPLVDEAGNFQANPWLTLLISLPFVGVIAVNLGFLFLF